MDRRAGLIAGALALAALTGPSAASAASGIYTLTVEGSHRACRIVLSAGESGADRALRFPAGCRRAIPLLNGAGHWREDSETVTILGQDRAVLLVFRRKGDHLDATDRDGARYRLARESDAPKPRFLPPAPFVTGVPQRTEIDPATAPKPETLPGLYSLDRRAERDTCRLVLAPNTVGAEDRREARIVEGCRDPGLRVFDPASWSYTAGRLTLRSRRGHEVTLVSERKDHWRRDPEIGATLELRKVEAP